MDNTNYNQPNNEFSRTDIPSEYHDMQRESWSVMFERLYSDMAHLFSKESELVKAELSEKIKDIKAAGISVLIGGSLFFVGVFALAMTAVFLLARVIPVWSASALVTAGFLLVGYILMRTALAKLDANKMKPRQSLETLGEIKTSFKERINEFKLHH